jgi:hypothetical protein
VLPKQQQRPSKPSRVILFGDAGLRPGGFMASKGGRGIRGPVKEIAKELAKYAVVIGADEFRTSKCCHHCGSVLSQNTATRVSRCTVRQFQCRGNHLCRDIDAAWKIGARFLAGVLNEELGAFDRRIKSENLWTNQADVNQKARLPQPQLSNAVIRYRSQIDRERVLLPLTAASSSTLAEC